MKIILPLTILIIILAACSGPASENQVQTAIAQTEAAQPTPEPTATPAVYTVTLEIRSTVVNSLNKIAFTIQYGKNGNISNAEVPRYDLPNEVGYKTIWEYSDTGVPGDEIQMTVISSHESDCVILLDEEEVATSHMDSSFDSLNTITCTYTIP